MRQKALRGSHGCLLLIVLVIYKPNPTIRHVKKGTGRGAPVCCAAVTKSVIPNRTGPFPDERLVADFGRSECVITMRPRPERRRPVDLIHLKKRDRNGNRN